MPTFGHCGLDASRYSVHNKINIILHEITQHMQHLKCFIHASSGQTTMVQVMVRVPWSGYLGQVYVITWQCAR